MSSDGYRGYRSIAINHLGAISYLLGSVMAVVEPKPSKADVRQKILKLVVGTVVGTIAVGVIGPIIAAIIIGEIWGH